MIRRYTPGSQNTRSGPLCSNCGKELDSHGDSPCRCCEVKNSEGYFDCPPDCPDENR